LAFAALEKLRLSNAPALSRPGRYDMATTAPQPGFPYGTMLAPARYGKPATSGLKYAVKSGRNVIDIDLKSR
jgi:hypothetical protein